MGWDRAIVFVPCGFRHPSESARLTLIQSRLKWVSVSVKFSHIRNTVWIGEYLNIASPPAIKMTDHPRGGWRHHIGDARDMEKRRKNTR
jgi:hypothetical protein